MEKAPFSLAESELSADTNLHLRGPVSKICAPQGPSLQGGMLRESPLGRCRGGGAPSCCQYPNPDPPAATADAEVLLA